MDFPLVTADAEVVRIAARIRDAGAFVLDLEFVPEGHYVPELGLVQIAWGDPAEPELAAIDPLETGPEPVFALVGDEAVETVLHSGQADLAILAQRYGITGRAVHDTQIAAAFVGMGDQIGYAPLVEHLLGVRLRKGSQYTDWLRRPLTDEQLAYALDDVRYLGRVWQRLRDRLDGDDRLQWVAEECARLASSSAAVTPPEESYRRVKGSTGLRKRAKGALRALAAWREQEARQLNRPPGQVVSDRALLELARGRPRNVEGLRAVRGIDQGLVRRHGDALLDAIREGAADPPEDEPGRRPLPPSGEVWASALHGLVRARALGAQIAPRFVGPRNEVEAVVRWWLEGDRDDPPPLPLLQGWRARLVGDAILEWLRGRVAIVADPDSEAGIILEPR